MRFRNNDLAAHAVYHYIRERRPPLRHLILRPAPRVAPQFAHWWLLPAAEWPAYRYAKFCFARAADTPYLMFVGFCVEKGLGRQLGDLVKANQLLAPNWAWYDFLNAARGGVLDAPMRAVIERTGAPLQVYLNLYAFNHVPDPETGGHTPDDWLEFVVHADDLQFTPVFAGQEALAPLNGAATLPDLVGRFLGLEQMTWYWIDWMIGTYVQYSPDDTGDWDAADLWHKTLEPWLRWVR